MVAQLRAASGCRAGPTRRSPAAARARPRARRRRRRRPRRRAGCRAARRRTTRAPRRSACGENALGSTLLAKIAPSAAIPVAIPSWRKVLLMPEAIPARSCRTVETAVDASGALTRPMPTPAIRKPGSSTVQCDDGVHAAHRPHRDRVQGEAGAEQDRGSARASTAGRRSARRRTRRRSAAGRRGRS